MNTLYRKSHVLIATFFTSGNEICFCHTIRKIVMYFTNENLENVSIYIIFYLGTTDS